MKISPALLTALAMKGDSTRVIDLAGKALLPGFLDAHGHQAGPV